MVPSGWSAKGKCIFREVPETGNGLTRGQGLNSRLNVRAFSDGQTDSPKEKERKKREREREKTNKEDRNKDLVCARLCEFPCASFTFMICTFTTTAESVNDNLHCSPTHKLAFNREPNERNKR